MIAGMVSVGGLMGLWFAVHIITTPNNGDMPRSLTVLLGLLCSLFCLALMAVGAFGVARAAWLVWRRDRLFLGDTHLRCVTRDGKVLTLIPYDNIDEIRFLEDEGGHNGPPDDKVAIILINPRRKDTVLLKESPLAPDVEEANAVLRDCYRLPPGTLYKKLVKRWRNEF